jgi:hypothetical protein
MPSSRICRGALGTVNLILAVSAVHALAIGSERCGATGLHTDS